jgi:uncharacterized protein (DUF849 family)
MLLQAALNGGRTLDEHPNIPITSEQIAAEVKRVIDTGADAIHFHIRARDGKQSLRPEDVSRTLTTVRAANPDVALGISTSLEIVGNGRLRHQLISEWRILPDYVSVNLHEEGSIELIEMLFAKGIGVEAGVCTPMAAENLISSGLGNDCLRILIEATEETVPEARANVNAIQAVLKESHLKPPYLLHGEGGSAWAIFEDAVAGGYDTRVGFEDMLTLPNGSAVESNAELIKYALDHILAAEKKSR